MDEQDVRYDFDHHSAEFAADPWRVYRDLRQRCPVAHSTTYDGGFWVLSAYRDVRRATLDTAVFSSDLDDLLIPEENPGRLLPVQSDPPLATAYRAVINPLFTSAAVRRLEPSIRRCVDAAIDAFAAVGSAELIVDLAMPVPGAVTMCLVGWPESEWLDVVHPIREFSTHPSGSRERAAAAVALAGLRERVTDNVRHRVTEPDGDLASLLVAGSVRGRPLTEAEMVDIMMMVLFGGVDTTVAAIGNMVLYLDEDRELRRQLIQDPRLISGAVEELLRYQAPVQGFARLVTEDTEIGGQRITQGEKVFLAWAAANRDPEVFTDPDDVRLDRGRNPHLAFGIGSHRCIGATLAKLELRIVLERLLARIPDYRVDRKSVHPTPSCGTTFGSRRIPVTFTPTDVG
ncbi:cytochrome P450 [Pseudonocardia spinosispora]|uniref:cytochrome P450 n=1 Tax=Pseudonocardia spinosispora TaxID=103441 RepID=UPI0003F7C06C|nr:cytochrome P450 [Pseudonocardia spinosispora]